MEKMVSKTIVNVNYLVTTKTLTNEALSTFGFIHEFWATPTAKLTYTRLQYYTNKVVGELGLQMFKIVVVVLSFDNFVPTSAHPLLFLDKWFLQIYLNVSYTSMIYIW